MRLVLSRDAEQDLDESINFLENEKENLGYLFRLKIEYFLNLIEDNPYLFPVITKNIRRCVAKDFRYGIFYVVKKTNVYVIAILHNSRNPKTWKKRNK